MLVQNTDSGSTFYDLDMLTDQEGAITINLTPEDHTVYFIVASMPEVFTDVEQVFSYEMNIIKGILGVEDFESNITKEIIGRFDMLGREVNEAYPGIQILLFSDGSAIKTLNLKKGAFSPCIKL